MGMYRNGHGLTCLPPKESGRISEGDTKPAEADTVLPSEENQDYLANLKYLTKKCYPSVGVEPGVIHLHSIFRICKTGKASREIIIALYSFPPC